MASVGRRVLIIVQNLPVPFDRRVWLESTALAANGYTVSVICPKLKGFNTTKERLEDVDIYRYPMPFDPSSKLGFILEFCWAWLATALYSLWIEIRGTGFDVIHACNPPDTYWLLAKAWRLLGKRFLFDHHDLSPEMYAAKFCSDSGVYYRLLMALERKTFDTADVAIATNESHRSIAIDRGAMSPDDVFVVRSGPDLKRLKTYEPDPRWGKGKKHTLVYLGDISPQDGVDGLVRVAKHLSERRDDFHIVVVGGGSALQQIRQHAVDLGVHHLFTFTGVVSDETLSRVLSSATIGVDTAPKNSWTDKSTMNKIMEYMYFGLPIVANNLAETIRSASAAVAVPEDGTEIGFSETISALLDDEGRRQEMSDFGRKRLVEELSWEHSTPNLLEAYERVRR